LLGKGMEAHEATAWPIRRGRQAEVEACPTQIALVMSSKGGYGISPQPRSQPARTVVEHGPRFGAPNRLRGVRRITRPCPVMTVLECSVVSREKWTLLAHVVQYDTPRPSATGLIIHKRKPVSAGGPVGCPSIRNLHTSQAETTMIRPTGKEVANRSRRWQCPGRAISFPRAHLQK
jgi:hypothetical protein